jgi:hypothetical protein
MRTAEAMTNVIVETETLVIGGLFRDAGHDKRRSSAGNLPFSVAVRGSFDT